MNDVWDHEADVTNDLMQVTFAKEDILNKLINATRDDMKQSCSDDAENFSRRYAILLVGQVKNEGCGEKLSQL